jgi:hypothetical protein
MVDRMGEGTRQHSHAPLLAALVVSVASLLALPAAANPDYGPPIFGPCREGGFQMDPIPPSPAASDWVVISFRSCSNPGIGAVRVDGSNIDIAVQGMGMCGPPGYVQSYVPVGVLAPGAYTVRLVSLDQSDLYCIGDSFAVGYPVPALDVRALVLLATLLCIAGVVVLRSAA